MTPKEALQLHVSKINELDTCMRDKDLNLIFAVLRSHPDLWFSPQGILMLAIRHKLGDTFIHILAKEYATLNIFTSTSNMHHCVEHSPFNYQSKPYGARAFSRGDNRLHLRTLTYLDDSKYAHADHYLHENDRGADYLLYERYRYTIKPTIKKSIHRFFAKLNTETLELEKLKELLPALNLLCLFVYKNSPLQAAAERGYTQAVIQMLNAGYTDNTAANNLKPNAFELACNNQQETTAQAIFAHELSQLSGKTDLTSLSSRAFRLLAYAERLGQNEIEHAYATILPRKSDLSIDQHVDANDDTLLHWAARQGSYAALLQLLSLKPALIHVKNKQGETPLHAVINSKTITLDVKLQIVGLLAQAGSQVNECDLQGNTALHLAVALQSLHLIMVLVHRYRANLLAMDLKYKTPLDYALSYLMKYESLIENDDYNIFYECYKNAVNIFAFLKSIDLSVHHTIQPVSFTDFAEFKNPLGMPDNLTEYWNTEYYRYVIINKYNLNDIQEKKSYHTRQLIKQINSWLGNFNDIRRDFDVSTKIQIEDKRNFIEAALFSMVLTTLLMKSPGHHSLFVDRLFGLHSVSSCYSRGNLSYVEKCQLAQSYFVGLWQEIILMLWSRQYYQHFYSNKVLTFAEKTMTNHELPYMSTAEIDTSSKERVGQTNMLARQALSAARTSLSEMITEQSTQLEHLLLRPHLAVQAAPILIPQKPIAPLQFLAQQAVFRHERVEPGSRAWCYLFREYTSQVSSLPEEVQTASSSSALLPEEMKPAPSSSALR